MIGASTDWLASWHRLTRCARENIFDLNFIFYFFVLFSRQVHRGGLKAVALTPYNRGGRSLARNVERWVSRPANYTTTRLLGGVDMERPPGLGVCTFKCTWGWVIIYLSTPPFYLFFYYDRDFYHL